MSKIKDTDVSQVNLHPFLEDSDLLDTGYHSDPDAQVKSSNQIILPVSEKQVEIQKLSQNIDLIAKVNPAIIQQEEAMEIYKNVNNWTCSDVVTWLEKHGLGQYKESFLENEINGEILLHLNATDINDLGIKKIGHRKIIEIEINKLNEQDSIISSTTNNTQIIPPSQTSSVSVAPSVSKMADPVQSLDIDLDGLDEESKKVILQLLEEEQKQRKLEEEKNEELVKELLKQENEDELETRKSVKRELEIKEKERQKKLKDEEEKNEEIVKTLLRKEKEQLQEQPK